MIFISMAYDISSASIFRVRFFLAATRCSVNSYSYLIFQAIRTLSTRTTPLVSAESLKLSYPNALSNVPETRITTLKNGFRVATEANANNHTATVGMWIDAGSRFETAEDNGVAHFLEHMAFKVLPFDLGIFNLTQGTKTRSQVQLEKQIENMGGHLNAYTSREQTVYYAKTLGGDVGAAVEILSDILQGSTLAPDAIERERGVILREAEEVEKNKEEVVFDLLHGSAFQGNPLGYTILGPEQNIKTITRQHLLDYITKNYTAERMVLVGSGKVDHAELVKLAEKYFGHLKTGDPRSLISKPTFVGSEVRARYDDHPTAHIAMAVEGASWTTPDYWPLLVAQAITGSWDRTHGSAPHSASKLAQNLSKHNFANSFMSFNTSYTDTGLFGTYVVTEATKDLDNLMHFMQTEWHRLSMNVSEAEVFRAKNQLKTSLLLSLDGTTPIAEEIGRQVLVYGKRLTPWEIDGLIEGVTAQQVMDVCKTYIYDKEVCVVGYGPVEGVQDYNRVRSAMSPLYY
jgi:mitochondrial-processing peptidase subunit beta